MSAQNLHSFPKSGFPLMAMPSTVSAVWEHDAITHSNNARPDTQPPVIVGCRFINKTLLRVSRRPVGEAWGPNEEAASRSGALCRRRGAPLANIEMETTYCTGEEWLALAPGEQINTPSRRSPSCAVHVWKVSSNCSLPYWEDIIIPFIAFWQFLQIVLHSWTKQDG